MQDAILKDLNTGQRTAVTHGDGPLLIVAGVGTGKTTVITRRIAWLIAEKRAKPSEILALTFTERAAQEMEARVDLLVPYGYIEATIGTFHGFCDGVLRENAVLLGLDPAFRILTEAEQVMFLKSHLFELPLERFRPLGNPVRHLRALTALFSRAKDEDISPEAYETYVGAKLGAAPDATCGSRDSAETDEIADHAELARVYTAYQQLLAANGCVDFGDLIALCLRLFREHPAVLERYRERYRYVLVDEFQDTNRAQLKLLQLIASHRNLNVCGDDDQSIYRFRGAAIDNVLGFLEAYPDAEQVVLTDNHRSTQPILDAAYRLIQFNNPDRLEVRTGITKQLRSVRGEGPPVVQRHFDTLDEESDFVAREVSEEAHTGARLAEIAILVRSNAQADPFLHALNLAHVPWRFSGSRGLYDQEEIRALVALLRLLADPSDSQSLHFLAASAPYAVNGETLAGLAGEAKRSRESLLSVMRRALRDATTESMEGLQAVSRVVDDVSTMLAAAARRGTGEVLYQYLTSQTTLLESWSNSVDEADAARVQNVAKLFSIVDRFARVSRYDRVPWFVDYFDDLVAAGDNPPTAEPDPDADAVHVLTVHQAKGLEFDLVFLVGLVDGRFPGIYRREPLTLPEPLLVGGAGGAELHRQEERRLFYVGMTRARRRLVLTSARDCGGKRARKPSQFTGEALDLPVAQMVREKGSPLVTIGRHAGSSGESSAVQPSDTAQSAPPLTLSFERISCYRSCPRRYRYRYVLDVPARPHHGMVYGRVIHRAIAHFYRAWQADGRWPTLDELRALYRSLWQSEGYLSAEHEELRFNEGLEAMSSFHGHATQEETAPALVEQRFAFFERGVKVVGVFDRVDRSQGRGVVIDYKTSAVGSEEEADRIASRDLQLGVYALAFERRFEALPDSLELHFLTPRLVVGRTSPGEKLLSMARRSLTAVAEGVRAQRFSGTPSPHVCRYCPYVGICPVRKLN